MAKDKKKEFLDKLNEAATPISQFTIKLELNGKLLAKKNFLADKYEPETLSASTFQFMLIDLSRSLQDMLRKKDSEVRKKRRNSGQ